MKKYYLGIILLTLGLVGCTKDQTKNNSLIKTQIGEDVVSVYKNGENVTEQYIQHMKDTYQTIANFLKRETSELEFHEYCRLGDEGATVVVQIDDEQYLCILYDNEPLSSIKRID